MKTKAKKIAIGGACVALVAAVSIGGTFAYLTAQTERRANNFTFSSTALTAMLTEPEWDGVIDYDYDGGKVYPVYDYIDHDNDPTTPEVPVYGYTDGDLQNPVVEKDDIDGTTDRPRQDSNNPDYVPPIYGDEAAQGMIPGSVAAKNPIITNNCDLNEYVAAKITFVYAEGSENAGKPLNLTDFSAVMDVISIDYNTDTTDWERTVGGETSLSQEFSYTSIVKPGDSTAAIFNSVTVSKDATNEQIKALEDIGGFAIWIEGYAAQSDAVADYATFKSEVVFNNTPSDDVPVNVARPGIIGAD